MSTRSLRTLVAAALVAAPLSLAFGQHEGRHGRHGRHDAMSAMRMLRKLDLTDEQRERIRALVDEAASTGIHDRMFEARKALGDAIENGADEATLRQLASELGEVEGDAAVERARIHARIQEILTPEQKQELERLKQEADERREERRRRFEERKSRKSGSGANPL